MRICLITGGGPPARHELLDAWCHTLVTGLAGYTFAWVAVTDGEPATRSSPQPVNVASMHSVTTTSPARQRRTRKAPAAATVAAGLLCRGLLDEHPRADAMFAEGLRRLAAGVGHPADPTAGAAVTPLDGVPLTDLLLEAWRNSRTAPTVGRLALPRLAVRDARTAATLLRQVTRALATPTPAADVLHCVGGTSALSAALAACWRTGTPLLLTDAGTAAARHRAAEQRWSPAVRTVLRRYRRAVARTGYAEARLVAPLSAYQHGWALRHGAHPARLVVVPAGVDPGVAAVASGRRAAGGPALRWCGGGAGGALGLVLEAFARVLATTPGTVLQLTGIAEAELPACRVQVEGSGLATAVWIPGGSAQPPAGQEHVVLYVPEPDDPPYRLIEAMMWGRPVIGVDVGPVAETLGDTGVLVPAGDPAGLAAACLTLLRSPARRDALGAAARARALTHFTAAQVVRAYDALYTDLAGPAPAPAYELALAVPAPRFPLPTTVRRLAQEER